MRKPMLAVVAMAIAGLSCTTSLRSRPMSDSLQPGTLTHDGLERTYLVYAPDSLVPGGPVPVVLALHGGGGTGEGMCTMAGGLMAVADDHAFVLVCPDGIGNHWNDGRGVESYRAHAEQIDDVGFLAALVDRLGEQYAIDRHAIFVIGISNGGLMSYRMACECADLVRGIAAVTASLPEALACNPSQPVSVLILNGTDDPLMPYEGGEISIFRRTLGRVRSTEDTYQFWAEANGCEEPAISDSSLDLDPEDGTEVHMSSLDTCADGTRVELYTISGGGHTWPGGPQYLPTWIIGRVSRELNASQTIWGFFSG